VFCTQTKREVSKTVYILIYEVDYAHVVPV
jgi:hypothetical protein